jgi:hypothetical protein
MERSTLSELSVGNKFEFRLYSPEFVESVKAFNERLRRGGETYYHLPETHIPQFSKQAQTDLYQEQFLLLHDGQVRGGYILTHQQFAIHGSYEQVTCGPQLALSEGVVDPKFGLLGALMVKDALARQPLMYALGMGGMEERLPKLLSAMGWVLQSIPFYFKVVNPERFFAHISYIRQRLRQRLVLDFLSHTRLGCLGLRLAQLRVAERANSLHAHSFDTFEGWADEVWERCRDKYALISVRDSKTLNVVYPPFNSRYLRLKVSRMQETVGWAVVLDSQMSGHKHFGDMRVGSIVDCLARPQDASFVIEAATRFLEVRGVDLIVSNQASNAWCKALAHAGFLPGPSNFILGFSQDLARKLPSLEEVKGRIHINRGNGDGPIHL